MRKAIAGLADDGLLTQRHGAGTFVADRIVKSFSKLTGFTDDLRVRGLKPRVKFLERSVGEVSPEEALALHLSPGARVVRLRRLRFAGDKPLALEDTVVPQSILRDPQAVKLSLYDALERLGCRPDARPAAPARGRARRGAGKLLACRWVVPRWRSNAAPFSMTAAWSNSPHRFIEATPTILSPNSQADSKP